MESALPANPTSGLHLAYAGLRVLDLSQGVAGPYCAQVLQQLGADVVKLEPIQGDWSRTMGSARGGMSALAIAFNRGKRSLACDVRRPEGQTILMALAAQADVVVQSFRPGVAERLGAGYAQVSSRNPAVIYVSISGFGLTGPYAALPATDSVAQAVAGMARTNGTPDGSPAGARPYAADIVSGVYAANAAGAALFARERSPDYLGTHIDVSLLACLAAWQNCLLVEHAWNGGLPPGPATVPQGFYETQDGHIVLVALDDRMFAAIADVLERPDWLADPALRKADGRKAAAAQLNQQIAAVVRTRPSAHWIERFARANVLAAPVACLPQLADDPQVRHLGLLQPIPSPEGGPGSLPFAGLPGVAPGAHPATEGVPAIGGHSAEILRSLQYDDASIARLADAGVIAVATAAGRSVFHPPTDLT